MSSSPSRSPQPSRTLLLCFVHGFKGDEDTFQSFPSDLRTRVAENLGPDHRVTTAVFPKYETKGELGVSTELFLNWLKERVIELRKQHSDKPWPPNDRDVGVVLVAHSMGGFVAADALFSVLDERRANEMDESTPLYPPIQGLLTFDTPFNGLARSMFVYGAFSNYQKVSSVFNVMTALGSAAPSAVKNMALKRSVGTGASSIPSMPVTTARAGGSSRWQGWQLVALRTGTVGAIAAGGVAAYVHRREIAEGWRNLNRDAVREGVKGSYQSGVDAVSQGLAYINRGNVGRSFEYLAEHFTFVGALLKQQELNRRLERMGALEGIGLRTVYASLGANGVWSGGYFVPERTFCAVPEPGDAAAPLFARHVVAGAADELEAHVGMFKPACNDDYDAMTADAADTVLAWFRADAPVRDDPRFAAPAPPDPVDEPVATDADGTAVPAPPAALEAGEKEGHNEAAGAGGDDLPDESPLDIAAAASMVPLPEDDAEADLVNATDAETRTYIRYLMGVAQQAGTGLRAYVPRTMPEMPAGPSFKSFVPSVSVPSMPSMPSVGGMWGRKAAPAPPSAEGGGEKKGDEETATAPGPHEVEGSLGSRGSPVEDTAAATALAPAPTSSVPEINQGA